MNDQPATSTSGDSTAFLFLAGGLLPVTWTAIEGQSEAIQSVNINGKETAE